MSRGAAERSWPVPPLLIQAFEPGARYGDAEVNEIMLRFSDDPAPIRRSLVEFGMMRREGGGAAYWRTDTSKER